MSVRTRCIHRVLNHKNQLHCDNLPALITNYRTEWWNNGKLHRVGGPAISGWNGYNYEDCYYLRGKAYDKRSYNKIMFIVKRFVNIIKTRYHDKITMEIYNTGICLDVSRFIANYVISV